MSFSNVQQIHYMFWQLIGFSVAFLTRDPHKNVISTISYLFCCIYHSHIIDIFQSF